MKWNWFVFFGALAFVAIIFGAVSCDSTREKYCGADSQGYKYFNDGNSVDCYRYKCGDRFSQDRGAERYCNMEHWEVPA